MSGRDLLMIPGPINFDPGVLREMAAPAMSHTSAEFGAYFGETLNWMKQVFLSPAGLPFVVAGSGTLAMDMAACNLIEPGDRALAITTGFFGDRMAAILEYYGAQVTTVRPAIGDAPTLERVQQELARVHPKVVAMTQVETSTGVVVDVPAVTRAAKAAGALVVVDGVCSIAGMEMKQDDWGVDVALTGSQKAIGVPPGLALMVASPRALEAFRARRTPVASYYASWANWAPVMETYLAGRPSYFGTPPVNLIFALHESYRQILAEGLDKRIARHKRISDAFKAGVKAIGLKQVPLRPEITAPTMTALYFPEGIDTTLIGKIRERGVVVAGGMHPQLKDTTFRVGHMGVVSHADVAATLSAIEGALLSLRYEFDEGAGLAAFEKALA